MHHHHLISSSHFILYHNSFLLFLREVQHISPTSKCTFVFVIVVTAASTCFNTIQCLMPSIMSRPLQLRFYWVRQTWPSEDWTPSHRVYSLIFPLICSTSIYYAVFVQALKINEFVDLKFCEEAVIRNNNISATATNCSVSTVGLTWVDLHVVWALVVSDYYLL